MKLLAASQIDSFVKEKPAAVVPFDAERNPERVFHSGLAHQPVKRSKYIDPKD